MFERPPGFKVDLTKTTKFVSVHEDALETNPKDVCLQNRFRVRYMTHRDNDYWKKWQSLADGNLMFVTFERVRREIQDLQMIAMLDLSRTRRPPITPVCSYKHGEATVHKEGFIAFTTRKRGRYVDVALSLRNQPQSVLGRQSATGQYIGVEINTKVDDVKKLTEMISRSLMSGELLIDIIVNKLWPELDKSRKTNVLPIEKPKLPRNKRQAKTSEPPAPAPAPPVQELPVPGEVKAVGPPEAPKPTDSPSEKEGSEQVKPVEQPEEPNNEPIPEAAEQQEESAPPTDENEGPKIAEQLEARQLEKVAVMDAPKKGGAFGGSKKSTNNFGAPPANFGGHVGFANSGVPGFPGDRAANRVKAPEKFHNYFSGPPQGRGHSGPGGHHHRNRNGLPAGGFGMSGRQAFVDSILNSHPAVDHGNFQQPPPPLLGFGPSSTPSNYSEGYRGGHGQVQSEGQEGYRKFAGSSRRGARGASRSDSENWRQPAP